MVQIIKADGTFESFKKWKIERTVLNAGGSKKFAREVANKVAKTVEKGTTSKEILMLTLKLLKKQPHVAIRYDLKRAIMSLGPHGFTFEEFFSQILKNYGYQTKVGLILRGKATTHEVDVLAKKDRNYMVEAKYHNRLGNNTDSKVAMYTYARYLDLHNNPKNKIDQGWLVTNTKCTHHAIQYANGVGLKITSWGYASEGANLQQLIKEKQLYPVTILNSVTGDIKERLARAKIVLAKEILNLGLKELKNKTGLREKDINNIIKEANHLFNP